MGFHPELLADRLLPKLSTITQPFSDGDKKEDILQEDEEEEEEMEGEGGGGGWRKIFSAPPHPLPQANSFSLFILPPFQEHLSMKT